LISNKNAYIRYITMGALSKSFAGFLAILLFLLPEVKANHLTGGDMTYRCISNGPGNNRTFEFTLNIYRDDLSNGGPFDSPLYVTSFNLDNNQSESFSVPLVTSSIIEVPLNDLGPCARNVPTVKIQKATYTFTRTFAVNNNGYLIAHQRCCRPVNITNLRDPSNQGTTYFVELTRQALLSCNSNPRYVQDPPILICANATFNYQFSAIDSDGDSLVYRLCEPKRGASQGTPAPQTASRPPYTTVTYNNGFSPTSPLGAASPIQLDPRTGLLTMRPTQIGIYTVAICIDEFRNGTLIGTISRDIQFNVADCVIAEAVASVNAAQPVPGVFASCNGQTIQFRNSSRDAQTYHWDFGVEGIDSDTSRVREPAYSYPDSGSYNVTLIINKGQTCADTANIVIRVYPILDAGFDIQPLCEGSPVTFVNTSTSTVDPIAGQKWYYNNQLLSEDKDLTHTFQGTGPFTVKLVIETNNGCRDSISKTFSLPPFQEARFTFPGNQQNNTELYINCSNSRRITFTNNAVANTPAFWDFGVPGATSTAFSPTYTFPDTGTYKITLVLQPNTVCADTVSKWVRILPAPEADFSFLTRCVKLPVEFTADFPRVYDPVVKTSWNFGDGSTSDLEDPVKTFSGSGTYNVTLDIETQGGCTATITKQVFVPLTPVADFTVTGEMHGANYIKCDNLLSLQFQDQSVNASSWFWTMGQNGPTYTQNNPGHIFPDTGTYRVSLIINRGSVCTDTITKNIRVVDGISRTDFEFENACVNTPVTFTNRSAALRNDISRYSWDFGDNTTATVRNPRKTYTAPGKYQVRLYIETALGCKDSVVKEIEIYPAPRPDFDVSFACLNTPLNIRNLSTITQGTITSYAWSFGNNTQSDSTHPVVRYNTPGNYTITLTATSDHGCTANKTDVLTVRAASAPDFDYTNQCFKAPVFFNDRSTSPYNDIVKWSWVFEPGETGSGQAVNHTFDKAGTHPVKLLVETSFGCKDSVTRNIVLAAPPVANFTIGGNNANSVTLYKCDANYSVTFTNQTRNNLADFWTFGVPGGTSTDRSPTHIFPDTGSYKITLITEPGTRCADTLVKDVRVLPPVVSSFTYSTECVKAPVFFNANTNRPFDPIKTIAWNFGDGTTSNEKEPQKIYDSPGTYTVRLTLTAESGCQAASTQRVTVAPAPVADFIPEGLKDPDGRFLKCEDLLSILFSNKSTGNTTNLWEFGINNMTSSAVSPSYTYPAFGAYQVRLVINQGKICSDSITKTVDVIHGIDRIDFSVNDVCVHTPARFENFSTAVLNDISEYLWKFGDNTTSTERNPEKTYTTAGTYQVTLYVKTRAGCIDSVTHPIEIFHQPVALFNVERACLRQQVLVNNQSTIQKGSIQSYLWNLGDNRTDVSVSPSISYAVPGFYPVSLTATSDKGCVDKHEDTIEIRMPAIPDFSYANQCFKAPVVFTDLSQSPYNDIVGWEWIFEEGKISNSPAPQHTYASDGQFPVKLTVISAYGCRDSIIKEISIRPRPIADFTIDGLEQGTNLFVKCDDSKTINFFNQSIDDATNNWNLGVPGAFSLDRNPQFVYPDTGAYTIRLIINQGTLCADTAVNNIQVLPGLYVDYSYSLACEKNEISFEDLSTTTLRDINYRAWDFGDNNNAVNISSAKHTYEQFGNYNVSLIIGTQRGCLDTLTKNIRVYALPIPDFTLSEACPDQRTRIDNTSRPNTGNTIQAYQWELGNGQTSTEKYPYVTYAQPGTYTISLIVSTVAGCKDSISDIVLVRDFIVPAIYQSSQIFCVNEPIIFSADASKGIFDHVLWEFGDGNTSTKLTDTIAYSKGGKYTITLTLTDDLCGSFSTTTSIEIIDVPRIDLGQDFSLCPTLSTTLNIGTTVFDTVIWSTGVRNLNQITVNGDAGTVSVEVFEKGCYVTDSITIIPSCDVLAPKAFSPNGDGVNDYFNVLPPNVQSYQLFVYNRWGNLVFTTGDLNKGWDGRWQGEDQPMDNYTYYATGIKTDGSSFAIQGAVLLVR